MPFVLFDAALSDMKNPPERVKTLAIIPSAGMGRRMGSGKMKNYLDLLGKPVLARTIEPFEASGMVDSIVVVAPPPDERFCRERIIEEYGFRKVICVAGGGAERQDSVENGLNAAGEGFGAVIVHDGARPLVTPDIIEKTIRAALDIGAAIAAVPVKDTIKEAGDGFVRSTLKREPLIAVQTPQAFRTAVLVEAFRKAKADGFLGTDESSLVERTGAKVKVVLGSYENIKITTPGDLMLAECILRQRDGITT